MLLDDTLAIAAVISPTPIRVAGVDDSQFVVTYSMWQRVLDSAAKVQLDPAAQRGAHSRRFEGFEHLITDLDPTRLQVLEPTQLQWPAAQLKAQPPWSNALRADWAVTCEAVYAVGGRSLLSSVQAKGMLGLWPAAIVAEVDRAGAAPVFSPASLT